MAIKRKKSGIPEIPLASTADMAFLLLIFFIVAASDSKEDGNPFDPPSTEKTKNTKVETPNLEIGVKPEGLFVDKQQFSSPDELVPFLQQKLEGKKDPNLRVVIISAARNVTYQQWSDVVSSVERAGGIPAPQMEEVKTQIESVSAENAPASGGPQ